MHTHAQNGIHAGKGARYERRTAKTRSVPIAPGALADSPILACAIDGGEAGRRRAPRPSRVARSRREAGKLGEARSRDAVERWRTVSKVTLGGAVLSGILPYSKGEAGLGDVVERWKTVSKMSRGGLVSSGIIVQLRSGNERRGGALEDDFEDDSWASRWPTCEGNGVAGESGEGSSGGVFLLQLVEEMVPERELSMESLLEENVIERKLSMKNPFENWLERKLSMKSLLEKNVIERKLSMKNPFELLMTNQEERVRVEIVDEESIREESIVKKIVDEECADDEIVDEQSIREERVREEIIDEESIREESIVEEIVSEECADDEIVDNEFVEEETVDKESM
ncbi:unnamed protein product [Phyllotreta striolata]|uniref:Uncharacterized protein n=1 Tax=Phyllotreta striolata TaxID=444603 RepID=A0A9N9TLS6_PHYSR|nr:unnamed protein product [Phyllotreta striolata]